MNKTIDIIQRFKNWKFKSYENNKEKYLQSTKEHKPQGMIISCCDSRINLSEIFCLNTGEFFIHRNIANFIPPISLNKNQNGTIAAIEYAVKILKISDIVIIGHSNCGGISSAYNYFIKNTDQTNPNLDFVLPYLNNIKPIINNINKNKSEIEQISELEKKNVVYGLDNLLSFPFIQKAINQKTINLHGLWYDLDNADLFFYEVTNKTFIKI